MGAGIWRDLAHHDRPDALSGAAAVVPRSGGPDLRSVAAAGVEQELVYKF